MRKIVTLLSGLLLLFSTAFPQTKEVTGQVTDDSGAPLPGVSVLVKGTKTGTTTDAIGKFAIQVKDGATLIISSASYATVELKATPGTLMTVKLSEKKEELSEVVVTALGIRREKKGLGYAVSTVDKKALELRPESDVVRLLNGKAPGVDIMATSGMSGSGTNIVIRGVNTISGSSTPLFIVDGVPFDASTRAQANFVYGNTTSSRFLDLDPNSIESINVLKGFSATVLYGELGRNGVVVVTTKNGSIRKSNKKMEVTVSQSFFINKVANLPEYQNTYGSGFDQSVGLAFFSNWGGAFKTPADSVAHPYSVASLNAAFPQYVGKKYGLSPKSSVEDFFRTGKISTTSVGVTASSANATFNANYTYMDDEGFTPGNVVRKNVFGMGGNVKLTNNFTFSATANYAITDFKAPPTSTSFGSNPSSSSVYGNLIYTPRAVDIQGLEYENPLDHSSLYYRPANDIQHPLWTVNNCFTGQRVDRIFGNLAVRYDILKNLNISYRLGYDHYTDFNFYDQNRGGRVGEVLGMHRTVTGRNSIWDHSVIGNYFTNINSDLTVNIDAGFNSQERIYQQDGMKSTQQLVYGLFDHDNFIVHENSSEDGTNLDYKQNTQSVGAFAQAMFGYKEYLFVTVGGRNSWTSNMEKGNNTLFYPSASVAFIPTTAFEAMRNNKWLNYLKLRGGYATSANFGDPYKTRPVLIINTNVFVDKVGTVLNSNSISNRMANPDLKPELLREIELGVESKFIDNRASVDFTVYKRVSEDQILERQLDPATGYEIIAVNAGSLTNQGIEIAVGYTVVRSKDWTWQLDANWTKNKSEVSGLPDDLKQIAIDGFSNEGLFAINGHPLGVIQGSYTAKIDPKTGQPSASPMEGVRTVNASGDYNTSNAIGIIGDPTPDFKMAAISTLSYQGFSFRMQWDWTQGGDMLAYTPGTLIGRGLTKDTEFDRLLPIILPGVKADGSPNDVQISASQAYFNNYSGFFGMGDLITYDATVIRLREASLSYSIPPSKLSKTPFGAISLTLSGQNLWYNAPNFPEFVNFDPETSSLGVSNVRGLEYLSGPTSRRFGASLRVSF